jgi:hypothetical protein
LKTIGVGVLVAECKDCSGYAVEGLGCRVQGRLEFGARSLGFRVVQGLGVGVVKSLGFRVWGGVRVGVQGC